MVIPTNSVLDDVCYPQAFTVHIPFGNKLYFKIASRKLTINKKYALLHETLHDSCRASDLEPYLELVDVNIKNLDRQRNLRACTEKSLRLRFELRVALWLARWKLFCTVS